MDTYNGSGFARRIQTRYGFEAGHVYALRLPGQEEILYEHLGHNGHFLHAKEFGTELPQIFTQEDFGVWVDEGRIDPRLDENSTQRKLAKALNQDIEFSSDLPASELNLLSFYWKLCRIIHDMRACGETSLTDDALEPVIRDVMAQLTFGRQRDSREKGNAGRGTNKAGTPDRTITARKVLETHQIPAPSTVRGWIRRLVAHDWDILALRDHRKGRVGYRAPKVTDPGSVAVMAKWVRAYMDRARPTAAMLYKLMEGSVLLDRVNGDRRVMGKPPIRTEEIESFAEANRRRMEMGMDRLPIPSLSTFERAIRKLPKFQVALAREGFSAARRKFKITGKREIAIFPGERVAVDCWRIQLMQVNLPEHAWKGLDENLKGKLAKLRFTTCMAICEATKVILGVRLSVNADSLTSMKTLEMVMHNKTDIALEAGCLSPWNHAVTPGMVVSDSGSEFIADNFRGAVRDIHSANEIGPASHPDARGCIERYWETIDSQLLQHFQGRTFGGVGDRGDYDAGAAANALVSVLAPSLVRYIVDVYHNSPHAGLGGQTPNDAWEEGCDHLYGVVPPRPRHELRAIFGFADNRRIQNRGIRFLGLYYKSQELSDLRKRIGQADIVMRADLENLGRISFRENVAGARWHSAECEYPMEGISAGAWMKQSQTLKARHASLAELRKEVVLQALVDIRAAAKASAIASKLGPSTIDDDDIRKAEKEIYGHLGIALNETRADILEGLETSSDDDEGENAVEPQAPEGSSTASERKAVRRRGNQNRDFLRKD